MKSFFNRKKLKPLSEQVIVITGASSGIGLATALNAARQGAQLVLASRNAQALDEAQRKIEDMGGTAVSIVADVGREEEVRSIAQLAIDSFGGFDTWVNNAGVSIIGKLEDVSDEDNRRLFDTNFWGIVYGSQIAAEHLKGKTGAIINLGSMLSDVAVPLQGMYSASKHAVKGFTDSFRHELEAEGADISVTLIKPGAIATPFFSHAKNYMHQEPKAPPPVYAPGEVAYAILHAAQHPVRDVNVGGSVPLISTMNAISPRLTDWINEKFMIRAQLSDKPKTRHKDNLHTSGHDGEIYGKDKTYALGSLYTRASLHPVATTIAATALGLIAYRYLGRSKYGNVALKGVSAVMPPPSMLFASALTKLMKEDPAKAAKVAPKLVKGKIDWLTNIKGKKPANTIHDAAHMAEKRLHNVVEYARDHNPVKKYMS